MRTVALYGFICLGLLGAPALAQAPGKPAVPQVSADPERLAAAREVVAAAQGDRAAVLAAMKAPMAGVMQQMGITDPAKAQVMVNEVVLPTLSEHYDDLLAVQALSFASVLSKEDLKAVAAFYGTPAGKNLVKAQPQLSQAMLTGMQQWMGTLMPQLKEKVEKAAAAHGWPSEGKRR
ncbi:DUF2059 domain-containing protein [Methylorubrum rhodesianum]|jgi:hypothetical protein|uniref:DUF2059 domain-containing protein n=1 Tax=Methylorubrum rhodesianum TaxID=29427 RepID=A0ABU9ZB98_9HYPH|nr:MULTISPECIES: DUF2059 domain-containing protein [Methylorubrum]MBB5765251.1 hypothetical protein [Methylorubrum rhodesianum]MBI1691274.1 DUF2059 domain-containing protein [Methylorubrum sp. DB1722]MBK3402846.1 DUF2059 domain-containing protein [Methylorubrum rhodesianum]MBY0144194.1 DUF2059 domain-containing protein [Methylorubrum populi]